MVRSPLRFGTSPGCPRHALVPKLPRVELVERAIFQGFIGDINPALDESSVDASKARLIKLLLTTPPKHDQTVAGRITKREARSLYDRAVYLETGKGVDAWMWNHNIPYGGPCMWIHNIPPRSGFLFLSHASYNHTAVSCFLPSS